MNDLTGTKNTKKSILLNIAELAVLLILPLPFLNLNILYVLMGVFIILLSKFLRKEKWNQYGFRSVQQKYLYFAIAIGILFGFIDNIIFEPLLVKLTGQEPDLTTFEEVKGNIKGLIGFLAIGWIIGGLFEELFFRGYIFHRFGMLFTNQIRYKAATIAITSVVFAFAHSYQGITGIIGTFYFAIIMGLLYFYFRRNIWYLIVIHGLFDTVGIVRLYLGY